MRDSLFEKRARKISVVTKHGTDEAARVLLLGVRDVMVDQPTARLAEAKGGPLAALCKAE